MRQMSECNKELMIIFVIFVIGLTATVLFRYSLQQIVLAMVYKIRILRYNKIGKKKISKKSSVRKKILTLVAIDQLH